MLLSRIIALPPMKSFNINWKWTDIIYSMTVQRLFGDFDLNNSLTDWERGSPPKIIVSDFKNFFKVG